MSKTLSALALSGLLSLSCFAETVSQLQPTQVQSATIKDVVKMLSTRHYRNLPIDDQLSEAFLDKYLESLDASRMYFYSRTSAALTVSATSLTTTSKRAI